MHQCLCVNMHTYTHTHTHTYTYVCVARVAKLFQLSDSWWTLNKFRSRSLSRFLFSLTLAPFFLVPSLLPRTLPSSSYSFLQLADMEKGLRMQQLVANQVMSALMRRHLVALVGGWVVGWVVEWGVVPTCVRLLSGVWCQHVWGW